MLGRIKNLFKAVVSAVRVKGPKLIVSLVPGGEQAYEFCAEVRNQLKDTPPQETRAALEEALQADPVRIEQAAREAVGEFLPTFSAEEKEAVTVFLSMIPETARRSFQRVEDLTGKTVPASLALDTLEGIAQVLPDRFPKLRKGYRPQENWELTQQLGVGGMGEVWLGRNLGSTIEDPLLKAFKFCTDAAAKALLLHEANKVRQVLRHDDHAGIVRLEDMNLTGDIPWLKYEYVRGGDLTRLILSKQNLPIAERAIWAAETIRQLADTVGYFHLLPEPIVHRDLKPANILVSHTKAASLKIADFGIGRTASRRAIEEARKSTISLDRLPTAFRGACTPLYASPQMRKNPENEPDVRDDVYALGVIWYQMIIGNLRLEAPTGGFWRATLAAAKVPADHIALLEASFDNHPEGRPANGAELAKSLGELLHRKERPVTVVPPVAVPPAASKPKPPEPAKPIKKNRGDLFGDAISKADQAHAEAKRLAEQFDFESAVQTLDPIEDRLRKTVVFNDYLQKRNRIREFDAKIDKGIHELSRSDPRLFAWVSGILDIQPNNEEMRDILAKLDAPGIGTTFTNSLGMTFTYIPKGKFRMGSPNGVGSDGERPQHEVTISRDFYMGVVPVTQEQWKRVMGSNPSKFKGAGHPVENVSWKECQTFIDKLPKEDGFTYRLPTEAEWEYACRAGTTTQYFFGDKESRLGEYGWFDGNSGKTTHPVKQKTANPWGLYDVYGNVWEWCLDGYGPYSAGAVIDPISTHSNDPRVLRGGS